MKKEILFVCVANSCRSQMAEGLARAFWGDEVLAFSAGSHPGLAVHPGAVRSLAEIGLDISGARAKGLDAFAGRRFDIAVSMGCGDACPAASADEHLTWDIPDPAGEPAGRGFTRVRGLLMERLIELLGPPSRVPGAD